MDNSFLLKIILELKPSPFYSVNMANLTSPSKTRVLLASLSYVIIEKILINIFDKVIKLVLSLINFSNNFLLVLLKVKNKKRKEKNKGLMLYN